MCIETLRKDVENSIVCNGINHPTTIKLNQKLENEINKKQKEIYREYQSKQIAI